MRRHGLQAVGETRGLAARALLRHPGGREGAGALRDLDLVAAGRAYPRDGADRRELDLALDDLAHVLGRCQIATRRVVGQAQRLLLVQQSQVIGVHLLPVLAAIRPERLLVGLDLRVLAVVRVARGALQRGLEPVDAALERLALLLERLGGLLGLVLGRLLRVRHLGQTLVDVLVGRQILLDLGELIHGHRVGRAVLLDLLEALVVRGLELLPSATHVLDRLLDLDEVDVVFGHFRLSEMKNPSAKAGPVWLGRPAANGPRPRPRVSCSRRDR